METAPTVRPARKFIAIAVGTALVIAGALGGWLFERQRSASAAPDRAAIAQIVRETILQNPEILPEAVERLRARQAKQQLANSGAGVETPFPGAVLGNPAGKLVLVEFSDYACTFCRRSVEDVDALIAANPDLKVVVRELPILSPASTAAARMALAAAEQGRFAQFHKAMYAAGRPDDTTITAAAQAAGLDMARARKTIADARVETEIGRNLEMARALGFDGTPSWIVGDQMLSGAVGAEELARAIAAARGTKAG